MQMELSVAIVNRIHDILEEKGMTPKRLRPSSALPYYTSTSSKTP